MIIFKLNCNRLISKLQLFNDSHVALFNYQQIQRWILINIQLFQRPSGRLVNKLDQVLQFDLPISPISKTQSVYFAQMTVDYAEMIVLKLNCNRLTSRLQLFNDSHVALFNYQQIQRWILITIQLFQRPSGRLVNQLDEILHKRTKRKRNKKKNKNKKEKKYKNGYGKQNWESFLLPPEPLLHSSLRIKLT